MWNDLNMTQRNELIKLYLNNGISSLDKMKEHYNSYATGGSLDEPPNEPIYVGGATAIKKNYDYALEHLADKYSITAEGPWHDYGIHNPSYSQRTNWKALSRMYNRVAQRPDYQYLNPTNILEYTPIVGDAIDTGNSIYNLQQGETGLGLVGLGTLILPNVIEKPLKTINKAAINLLDDIRYSKYKKNARHIANNAYTNHLKRVGLTRNDIGSTDYRHSEDITRNIIQQNNYDVSTIDGRRQFLQDTGKLDKNATNEQVDNAFLKFLQLDNYNGNNRPGVYTFNNLKGQVMAVSDDAGMNFSRRKAAKGSSSNISLHNGQISDNFDWFNGNNESIKSHELTHYLQYKNNLIDGSRVNNIFDYNKLNNLSDKIKNYFTIDNGTEADARLSQILDFYNISNDKKIKPSHIRYIKNNYTGINNNMLPFLQALADDKEVADYINKNRKSKFLENGGKINT